MMQQQIAGKDSFQTQIGQYIVNNGITEERVRTVISEMTAPAHQEALLRITNLEKCILERIEYENQINGKIEIIKKAFVDPAFLIVYEKAKKAAVGTEKPNDYALLTELLMCHVKKGNDRSTQTWIKKAIEIVVDIDNNALCGLTVAHAIGVYTPVSGDVNKGLSRLDKLFSSLLYTELPIGMDWIDQLDTLGALRINPVGKFKQFRDFYRVALSGYVCVGIKIDSDEHRRAIELLNSIGLPINAVLVPNALLDGYVRLCLRDINNIKNNDLSFNSLLSPRQLNEEEIRVIQEIFKLYSKDQNKLNTVMNEFIKRWDSYESLKKIRMWWEKIPGGSFDISKVGQVLAHINAKRCDSSLPDLL